LYMLVEGRVRLTTGNRTLSEVGPGEAFGTWALVDDSQRGHRADCVEDGVALALHRDEFYEVAASDLTLLQEVVRVLAKRLRALPSDRPGEARVEGGGIEKPEAMVEAADAGAQEAPAPDSKPPTAGSALAAAAVGQPTESAAPDGDGADPPPSE